MSEFPFSTGLFLSSLTSKPDTSLSQMPFIIPTHSHKFHSATSHYSDCVNGTTTEATIPREVSTYEQIPHNQHTESVPSTVRISSPASKPNVELIYAFTSSHPPSTSIHPMQTRSKFGIYKPKVFNSTTTTPTCKTSSQSKPINIA